MTALGPRTRGSRAAAPGRGTIPFCECANTTPTEPSCGIGGGAGGRPRVHSGEPRGRCSGPRGQRDPAEGLGPRLLLQCLQAGELRDPRGFPAFCWLLGSRGSQPPPHPSSSAPPTPRPPGPRFSPAATALAPAGPRMGSSFRACPLPSSPTLVLRVLCLAQPRPKRRPRRAALEQPRILFWGEGQAAALGPCPGRKGRVCGVGKGRRAGQAGSPALPGGRPEVGRPREVGRPVPPSPNPGPSGTSLTFHRCHVSLLGAYLFCIYLNRVMS